MAAPPTKAAAPKMTAFWVARGTPPVLELEAFAVDPAVDALLPPVPADPDAVVDSVVGTAPGLLTVELAEPADDEPAPAESFSAPAVTVTGRM